MRAPRVSSLLLIGILTVAGTGAAPADSLDQDVAATAARLSKPAATPRESAIAVRVKARLAARHLASQIKVRSNDDTDGIIWLSGTVPTVDAAAQATRAAMETEGVTAVHNGIVVR